jgi:type IV secretion system protein VirB4
MKWTGPAQWMKREAKAGDRLPFDRHIDDATIRLRDGAVMRTLHIGGMEFETQDSDQLDHAQAVGKCSCAASSTHASCSTITSFAVV